MVYSVALPQNLAEAYKDVFKQGAPSKRKYTDVFEGLDAYLRAGIMMARARPFPLPTPQGPTAPAPARTPAPDNVLISRWLGMLYMPPVSMEVAGTQYDVHEGVDATKLSSVPLAGEQVTHTYKLNFAGELHLTPLDRSWVSFDLVTKANLNRLDTYNDTNPRLTQTALSPDDWLNGATLRSREITNRITEAVAGLSRKLNGSPVRVEPFVGCFNESSIYHLHRTLTTMRPVTTTTMKSTIYLTEDDRKPNFTFVEAGVGMGDISVWGPIKLKTTSYRFDWGTNHTALSGVNVGGLFRPIDDVRTCGIQGLIDEKCGALPLVDNSRVDFLYVNRRENRQQFLTTLEIARSKDRKIKFSVDFIGKLWRFDHNETTLLEPLWSTEYNLKLAVPVGYAISIGPYLRYYRVKAFGEPGAFSSDRYGVTMPTPFYGKLGIARFLY